MSHTLVMHDVITYATCDIRGSLWSLFSNLVFFCSNVSISCLLAHVQFLPEVNVWMNEENLFRFSRTWKNWKLIWKALMIRTVTRTKSSLVSFTSLWTTTSPSLRYSTNVHDAKVKKVQFLWFCGLLNTKFSNKPLKYHLVTSSQKPISSRLHLII